MTLEEAKEIVSEMYAENADKSAECACKYNDFETANYFDDRCKAIETVLKALEDSIPKEKVRNKMEELNKNIKNAETIEAVFMIKQQQALDELLRE